MNLLIGMSMCMHKHVYARKDYEPTDGVCVRASVHVYVSRGPCISMSSRSILYFYCLLCSGCSRH